MNVICFGDSNTFGFNPCSYLGGRYSSETRWVNILAAKTGWTIQNQGLNGREIPARGENLFQELALELDSSKFRSKARFPNNPSFQVELTAPKPDTIVRKAVLTLPSGIEVTLSEASIKSLIMAVVLYEEANTWINE